MNKRDFNYWRNLVLGSVRGLTEEQALEAAGICQQAEDNGEWTGTWHAASIATGTLDTCCCARCHPVKRYA